MENQDKIKENANDVKEVEILFEQEYYSQGNDSSTNSATGDTDLNESIKSKYTSLKNKTPKLLLYAMQLIGFIFISMLIISTVNYTITLNKTKRLVDELKIIKLAEDRIRQTANSRMMLMTKVMIANGWEKNESSILTNRLQSYTDYLDESQRKMRNTQMLIDNAKFEYSQKFYKFVHGETTPIFTLDSKNVIHVQNYSQSFGINALSDKLVQLNAFELHRLVGHLFIQTIYANRSGSYRPTDDEKLVFWGVINAYEYPRSMNWVHCQGYMNETIDHANQLKSDTATLVIISVCSIILVGLIVTPIMSKIYDKQYQVLHFFSVFKKEQLETLSQKAKQTHELFENHFYQNHKMKGKDKKEKAQNNKIQRSNMITVELVNSNNSSHSNSQNSNYFQRDDLSSYMGEMEEESKENPQSIQSIKSIYSSKNDEAINVLEKPKSKIPSIKKKKTQSSMQSVFQENMTNKKQTIVPKLQFQTNKLKKQISKETSKRSKNNESNKSDEAGEKNDQIVIIKNEMLKKNKYVTRRNVFLVCICLIQVLSIYFVASYFFCQRFYSQLPTIINDIHMIYMKDACIEVLQSYIRYNQVRNESVPRTEDGKSIATTTILKQCYGFENAFRTFRMDYPDAFKELSTFIDKIESDQVCKIGYSGNQTGIDWCESVYDGVLKLGLSETVILMLHHYQKVDLAFQSLKPFQRDAKFLLSQLSDNTTSTFFDLKDFVLRPIFALFQDKTDQAVQNYFYKLLEQYLLFYSLFVVILTCLMLSFSMVLFKRIKRYLWRMRVFLKVLPIEMMISKDQNDLKEFFNQQE